MPKKAAKKKAAKKTSAKKAAKKAVEKATKKKVRRSRVHVKVISVSSPAALQREIDSASVNARYPANVQHLCMVGGVPWFLLDWSE